MSAEEPQPEWTTGRDKKYPYVEITKGCHTKHNYSYMLKLWLSDGERIYNLRFAHTLWGARREAKKFLLWYDQMVRDEQFKEEVRL